MHQNPLPNPLTDPIVPGIFSHAIAAAAETGLFDVLAHGPMTAGQAAKEKCLDPICVQRVYDVLVAGGYLTRKKKQYELSDICRETMVSGAAHQLSNWAEFCRIQMLAVSKLPTLLRGSGTVDLFDLAQGENDRMKNRRASSAVSSFGKDAASRTGHSLHPRSKLQGIPAGRITHQRAMAETARPISRWIAGNVVLRKRSKVILDVGGSHGLYSAEICKYNPPMSADVLELSSVIQYARKVSAEYGTHRYCTHVEGDIETIQLQKTYDAVFLGNIVHHFTEQKLEVLFDKLANCLCPGGLIIIWDLFSGQEDVNMMTASFSLLFYLTSGAKCHDHTTVQRALENAGFADIRYTRPDGNGTHMLLTGCRE